MEGVITEGGRRSNGSSGLDHTENASRKWWLLKNLSLEIYRELWLKKINVPSDQLERYK